VSAGFDLPGGESTAAALRRLTLELDATAVARDQALDQADDAELECSELRGELEIVLNERNLARAEVSGVRASLAELADEVEDLNGTLAMRTGQLKAATRERDLARAELASARQELDAIRREAGAP
jgi:chromosome segregation ATPase